MTPTFHRWSIWGEIVTNLRHHFIALRCWIFHRRHRVERPSWAFEASNCAKCSHRFTGREP